MTIGPPLNISSLPGIFTRVVGRDNELRLLRSGLDLVVKGRGVFFLLTGEPGIGKTHLAREITSDAIGRGFVVESGRGWEGTRAPKLWPWLKILQSRSFNDSSPTLYFTIKRHVPEEPIDGSAKEGGLKQLCGARFDFAWLKVVQNVAASFKKAASKTPLLLILDDLQAADRCSLELLRFLSRELHDSPIMLIAISRDFEIKRSEFLREMFVDLARNGIHLALGGLGSNAIAQLVEGTTGAKADPGHLSFLIDATAGNPFLLLELLKLPSAQVNSAIGSSRRLPNALVAATNSHLDSLSAHCQEVLRVASTIGRQFDLPILLSTLGSETDELLNRLDEALDAHILREAANMPGRYLFVHGIVRDALYQQNNGSRRLYLHRRIAEVLRDIFADCLETHLGEIATHYFEGGERDSAQKALEFSERAGARANLLFEFREAARFYAMAVTACDLSAQPGESHRCDLLIEMAVARSRAGEEAQAQLIFQEAARMAERGGYPERIARAVVDRPEYCPAMLRLVNRETVRLLSTAAQQLDPKTPLAVRVIARLGSELWLDTESRPEGEAMVARSREMARLTGDPEALLAALMAYDLVLSDPDRIAERVENASRIIDLAIQLRDYRALYCGSLAKITSFSVLGDITHADSVAQMMIQASEMAHEAPLQWAALGQLASKNFREGKPKEGQQYVHDCLALALRIGNSEIFDLMWPSMIAASHEEGELEELAGFALRACYRRPHLPLFGALLASIYCGQGRTIEARLQFDKIVARGFPTIRRDGLFLATLAALAEVSIRLNDAPRAAELYELLLPYQHLNILIGPATLMGPAGYYLARLAALLSRSDAAQQHCLEAIRLSGKMGAVCWTALTQYELCRALLLRDRCSESGKDLLESLLVTARGCTMRKLEEEIDVLRLSVSGCLPAPTPLTEVSPATSTAKASSSAKGYHQAPTKGHAPTMEPACDDRIFRREGDYWTLSYEGKTVRLRHLKGLGLISCLLRYPGRRFLAVDLAASAGDASEREATASNGNDSSPILDTQAKASYREHLQQLREDLDEARSFNDQARVARVEEEIAFLTRELARALGIFGRDRMFSSGSERARLRVTNSIRAAIKSICAVHFSLGQHLTNSIKTGSFCSYAPESFAEANWQV